MKKHLQESQQKTSTSSLRAGRKVIQNIIQQVLIKHGNQITAARKITGKLMESFATRFT